MMWGLAGHGEDATAAEPLTLAGRLGSGEDALPEEALSPNNNFPRQ